MEYEYFGEMRPYKHQLESIKFMAAHKKAYLFLDIGLGKSATCLWFADMLFHQDKIKKILIISPLSTLHAVWANEVKKVCPYREYAVVHGTRKQRLDALNSKAKIFITNTDAVRNFEKELIALRPDIVIVDEVTSFANAQSQRSKCLQRLSKSVKAIYGLSGSPVAGGLMNSYGIAKAINPKGLPTQYFSRYRELIMYQVNMYEYIPREGALEVVNKVLQPAVVYSKEECIDLPDIVFEERFVQLPKETMALFTEMLKHQIAEVKEGTITASTAGVKMIRLLQILTGSTKTEEGTITRTNINPKLDELASIYHEAGCKLVVFGQSVESVKIIKEFFLKKNIHAELIYGDVNTKERGRIIEEFQSLEKGVLVAQYRTMSHGITLTAASTLVFFGVISGNEAMQQCIGRIRRISQNKKQTIIKLISSKFERAVFKKMDDTELTAQAMLDIYRGDIL